MDRDHPGGRVLGDRRALQPRAVQRADRQQLPRDRDLRPLERLQPSRPHPAPSVLVAPPARLPPPLDGLGDQKTFGEQRRRRWPAGSSPRGAPTSSSSTTATDSRSRSSRSRRTTSAARGRQPESPTHPLLQPAREQPAEGLAGALDLETVDGVEPTNNPAERALRAPVIHRKLSLTYTVASGARARIATSDRPRRPAPARLGQGPRDL